jgi:hypothetical protein
VPFKEKISNSFSLTGVIVRALAREMDFPIQLCSVEGATAVTEKYFESSQ